MSNERVRNSARVVVLKDDCVLLIRRNNNGRVYSVLPGGGIELGEHPNQAAERELAEETTVVAADFKLVAVGEYQELQDQSYYFYAKYISGQPKLDPASEEFLDSQAGVNLYQPEWVNLAELSTVNLVPEELKVFIIESIKNGWPLKPKTLQHTWQN